MKTLALLTPYVVLDSDKKFSMRFNGNEAEFVTFGPGYYKITTAGLKKLEVDSWVNARNMNQNVETMSAYPLLGEIERSGVLTLTVGGGLEE